MKKPLSKIGIAFKSFFSSLWNDIAEGFRKHWLGMLGKIIMFIVPLAYIVSAYIQSTPSKWSLPVFAWIPIFVFILVYWAKLRSYLAIKVSAMTVENNIDKGKHAGAIIIIRTVQAIFTALPFFVGYRVFAAMEAESISAKNVFLFITICEAVGGLLLVIDTIANVIDYSGEENENA